MKPSSSKVSGVASDHISKSPSEQLPAAKSALRKKLRVKIEGLHSKPEKSAAICATIIRYPSWKKADVVAIFAPMRIEPNVELLWQHAAGKKICYPLMRMGSLDFVRVDDPSSLVIGPFGIREPLPHPDRFISPTEIDLILVPGYAFSAEGRRLGRGGGFYDRLLATPGMHARKLAVAFHCQLLKNIPCEPHDQRVHRIVTEKGLVPNSNR